ncbi:hypothetical protein V1478_016084 [Vespula squamosa]|uniref:Uncharacterized protein n=1 Tax=Vespula squamosa TaxID=30214 RepID=A0ABD1ZZD1_VESSQ
MRRVMRLVSYINFLEKMWSYQITMVLIVYWRVPVFISPASWLY